MKTKVTENEYEQIKVLTDHNLPTAEIERITGRKHATIQRVKASDDYNGYLKYIREHSYKGSKKEYVQIQHPEVKTDWQRWYDSTIMQIGSELKQIREMLGLIVRQIDTEG